jgi:hypothetical protein
LNQRAFLSTGVQVGPQLAEHHGAGFVDPVHLKDALRCVQSDRADLAHMERLLSTWAFRYRPILWLFDAGEQGRRPHHSGGERAAAIYLILQTTKSNGVNPEAYLTDTLSRIAAGHPISRISELMPWAFQSRPSNIAA